MTSRLKYIARKMKLGKLYWYVYGLPGRKVDEAARVYDAIHDELLEILKDNQRYPFEEVKKEALGGSLKFYDAYIFKKILTKHKPKTILEIGSFLGFSTRWLLEVSAPWNAMITAVDPNIRHRIFDNPRLIDLKFNSQFIGDRLTVIEGFFGPLVRAPYFYWLYDKYEPRLSKAEVDQLLDSRQIIGSNWPHKYDLIFIDGEHAYDAAKANFITALPLLNQNGRIIFHDVYSIADVTRFLVDISSEYRDRIRVRFLSNFHNKLRKNKYINRYLHLRYQDGLAEITFRN